LKRANFLALFFVYGRGFISISRGLNNPEPFIP